MLSQTLEAPKPAPGLDQTLLHEAAITDDEAARAMPTGHARYAHGRELGRGGMGRVYEAVDLQFSRVVAVKEITAQPSASTRRRFATEAIITGHLEHPGIPSVYERGVDDKGVPFYAMRRVQGRTLTARLAEADTREKRLALLPLVTRVAQTIGFAHDHGVVHRDIKPDNILVGDHGEVVVLDWGLARVRGVPVDSAGSSDLPISKNHTLHGAVIGTPAYMAPEQASGDLDRIDERSDVFALGALLFHLLTGAAPYRGDTIDEILGAAREAKLPAIAAGTPPELVAICMRATARDPSARHRNAHALASDLEAFTARAVLGRPSRGLQIAIDAVTAIAVLIAFVGVVGISQVVSSVKQQGFGAYIVYGFGAIGSVLCAIEWQTRGRYKLSSLAIAFAAATFLAGVVAAASGASMVFGGLKGVDDSGEFRALMANGIYELLGSLAVAAVLTIFQLLLWAAAKRRVTA